jgi:hypothetical protein
LTWLPSATREVKASARTRRGARAERFPRRGSPSGSRTIFTSSSWRRIRWREQLATIQVVRGGVEGGRPGSWGRRCGCGPARSARLPAHAAHRHVAADADRWSAGAALAPIVSPLSSLTLVAPDERVDVAAPPASAPSRTSTWTASGSTSRASPSSLVMRALNWPRVQPPRRAAQPLAVVRRNRFTLGTRVLSPRRLPRGNTSAAPAGSSLGQADSQLSRRALMGRASALCSCLSTGPPRDPTQRVPAITAAERGGFHRRGEEKIIAPPRGAMIFSPFGRPLPPPQRLHLWWGGRWSLAWVTLPPSATRGPPGVDAHRRRHGRAHRPRRLPQAPHRGHRPRRRDAHPDSLNRTGPRPHRPSEGEEDLIAARRRI